MAHLTLRALLMHNDEGATNAAMVEDLRRARALHSPECINAFKKVDRGHFWVEGSGSIAYADMPLRHGKLHQSAPHIYARALEALLPLRPGVSFLNVGSGTGYFSCLVHELTGEGSVNDGIDIWPETVAHAQDRCRTAGRRGIELREGNVYQLDINVCMRYDRIYIGACASQQAAYLYDLLELGGILVAPFQSGHSQQLRRVVRQSETQFKVEVLNLVQFATLVEPAPTAAPEPHVNRISFLTEDEEVTPAAPDAAEEVVKSGASPIAGLPGVPFTFAIRQRPWTLERSWAFPATFRSVAAAVVTCRARDLSQLCLPLEIWVGHILPWCPRWWFEPKQALMPSPSPSRLLCALEIMRRALLVRRVGRIHQRDDDDDSELTDSTSIGLVDPVGLHEDDDDARSDASGGSENAAPDAPESIAVVGNGNEVWLLTPDNMDGGQASERGARMELGRAARRFWRCVGRCCQMLPVDGLFQRCVLLRRFAARGVQALRLRRRRDGDESLAYLSVAAPSLVGVQR